MVCFMFLHYNTQDKTRFNSIALPLFVLATFHATSFLINCCRCRKCYGNAHDDNRSKCCGAFTNILLISASTALVVVGYFADNNMLFPTWPPFLKNFSLYFTVAVALGLSNSLLSKQRKSLIITDNAEVYPFLYGEQKAFYDATKLVQTFLVFLYHGLIAGLLIAQQQPDVLDQIKIRSIVYYQLIPGQLVGTLGLALFVQFFSCLC